MGSAVLGEAISAIRNWSVANGSKRVTNADRRVRQSGIQRRGAGEASPEDRLSRLEAHDYARRGIGPVGCRRGRVGCQGLGGRTRRDSLHALVSATHRHHCRKARFVLESVRQWQGRSGVLGQGVGQGRARRLELPVGRHAIDLRGARLHGVGSDEPALAALQRRRRHPRHPDRLRQLDRRNARQEDTAAALDGSAVETGGARPEAVRLDRPSAS